LTGQLVELVEFVQLILVKIYNKVDEACLDKDFLHSVVDSACEDASLLSTWDTLVIGAGCAAAADGRQVRSFKNFQLLCFVLYRYLFQISAMREYEY